MRHVLHRLTPLLVFGGLAACSNSPQSGQLPPGYGKFANLCASCQTDDQCGVGGVCTNDATGAKVCTSYCTAHSDCALGFQCYQLSGQAGRAACLPANQAPCQMGQPNPNNNGQDGGTTTNPGNQDSGTGMNPPPPDAGMAPPDSGVPGNPTMFPTCTPDTWSNWASNFVQANCFNCHMDYTYGQVTHLSATIRMDVQTGKMPKNATLSADDITRFTRWIDCDMPP